MRNNIIQQQIEYYRARASEYDEWFYRQGRYDRGEEFNARWFNEVDIVKSELRKLPCLLFLLSSLSYLEPNVKNLPSKKHIPEQ